MRRMIMGIFMMLAVGIFAAQAGAAAPRAIPHGRTPFATHFKTACPVVPGQAHCFALVATKANAPERAIVTDLPAGYGPVDLRTAYGLTSLSAHDGAGETVAIVDAGGDTTARSDLAVYRSTYGLPAANLKIVNQTGGSSLPPSAGWEDEISLDLDMVSAIAPKAHILLVEGDTASFPDLGDSVNEAVHLGATQVSNSYGGDEFYGSPDNSDYHHAGVSVTASSGDNGYYGDGADASFPASSQYVTAVGGTSLFTTSPRTESAWDGAGAGCSTLFPKPAWQKDSGCSKRMVSDVSANADPDTGVAIYDTTGEYNGGWYIFGGTSESSPIIASVDALVGPQAGTPAWPYQHVSDWNDVTSGSDGSCVDTYFCTSGPGYDGPTGLGTPNGAKISPGPPPPPPPPTYRVPKLRNDTVAKARRILRRDHLRLGKVHRVRGNGVKHGRVLRQSPRGGSRVLAGRKVALWVRR